MSAWSDGAPTRKNGPVTVSMINGMDDDVTPMPSSPKLPPLEERRTKNGKKLSAPQRATKAVSKIRQFEGPRGYSSRAAVYLRYVAYFFAIVIGSALTEVFTEGIPNADGGGKWMFFAMTTIVVGGAVASVLYTNLRNEIVEKVRHYLFGYALLPGVLVALFLYVSRGFLGMDAFSGMLGTALPVVFLCTVIIPSLVFIKEIMGMRTMYRSRLDDQEAVALWTRNDGHQR